MFAGVRLVYQEEKIHSSFYPGGIAVCYATSAPAAGALGRPPACSTGFRPLLQRPRSRYRDTAAGFVALSCPASSTLSVLGKRNPSIAEGCPESALHFHFEAVDVLL